MGDWTSGTYITSQVIVTLAYVLLGLTFFIKNRKAILYFGIGFSSFMAIALSLIDAWVGVGMFSIGIVRNVVLFLVDKYKREENKNRLLLVDWIVLATLASVMIITTYFTMDGWLTWFGFMASFAFTVAVWQKNVFWYRVLGLVSEVLWLVYHAVVENVSGIVFAGIMSAVILVGLILFIVERVKARKVISAPQVQ